MCGDCRNGKAGASGTLGRLGFGAGGVVLTGDLFCGGWAAWTVLCHPLFDEVRQMQVRIVEVVPVWVGGDC